VILGGADCQQNLAILFGATTIRHLDDGRGGPGVQRWSGAGWQGRDGGAGGKDAAGWVSENAVNRSMIIDSVSWFGTQVTSAWYCHINGQLGKLGR
jgi:hypothetical protein